MVAVDQRESLRTIIAERAGASPADVPDEALVAFKVAVARVLSPLASALLVDREHGLEPILADGSLARSCAMILAADSLDQQVGEPIIETHLDDAVDAALARHAGAKALKLLVLWQNDGDHERRRKMVEDFVARCRDAALVPLVETVVRPPLPVPAVWTAEVAMVEAARQLGQLKPDLYAAEVPFRGKATADRIHAVASRITDARGGPWVVLSHGVESDDLSASVAANCAGGAAGFLGGSAIWTDAIDGIRDVAGYEAALRERSAPRLAELARTVDRC
jgi:sulfofructosephosphate aldolase